MKLLFCAVAAITAAHGQGLDYIRANYTKYEYEIPMRDGKKLFTSIYAPKDAAKRYPILLTRTPYSVRPYGADDYRTTLGPSEAFAREGFIFAYQDVRGRYMSEGEFVEMRPRNPSGDESTDTYDTIEWLVRNLKNHNGKVGLTGISYPGFYALAALIDAHPALAAVSPQAPVTDYYLGDDSYHNGAFMLAANFGFYTSFVERKGDPEAPQERVPFNYKTPDGYDFYRKLGSLINADEKYFQRQNPYWTHQIERPNYDEYWQARSIWKHLHAVKPAVLTVGGWYDAEDLQGPLRVFRTIEQQSRNTRNAIVMGPWTHGSWARGDGQKVGNIDFGSKTGEYFRNSIELPFFLHHLKDKQDVKVPKAHMFQTGVNEWRQQDTWPPAAAAPKRIYLRDRHRLSFDAPAEPGSVYDEYLSDPNKPVPYIGFIAMGMTRDYMADDQRFASQRPDVLTYEMEPLRTDLTIAGPLKVHLTVSTSGTDSDFVVKLIDAFPGEFPGWTPPPSPPPPGQRPPPQPSQQIRMGGFQQLVRGEPFRARFRNSFEKPEPMTPNKPETIAFEMPDIYHTFRRGHRLIIQVQSSWFPLTDRNPQQFVDVWKAREQDYRKATQRVYRSRDRASYLEVLVEP